MPATQQNILNLYNYTPLVEINPLERGALRITKKSMFSDVEWDYSDLEKNPNVKPSGSILRWDFPCGNDESFDDPKFTNLRTSFKELVYCTASNPMGKAPAPSTLKKTYTIVRRLINWLIDNEHHCLSKVNREDLNPYIALINNDSSCHPRTKSNRLKAAKLFWDYQDDITLTLNFDPFSGKSAFAASGITRDQIADHKYDFIPDEIAQELIRSCIHFIRDKGTFVAAACLAREEANLDQIKQGKSKANRDRAKQAALAQMDISNAEVTTLSRQLLASCYLVIGFFTGVRASEMLSMVPDRIYKEDGVTWVHGRQVKITDKARRWMAPEAVFEAHHLAKLLTHPMRDAVQFEIDNTVDREKLDDLNKLKSNLFLNWSSKRKHGVDFKFAPQVSNIHASIHTSLKEIVELFSIVDAEDNSWNLHPHQLRKTFVRFMCSNAMNIRYLQEHMGHRSLDMTAWYDSDDVELTGEILRGIKEFKSQKLSDIFYNRKQTAGAAADSINQERKDYFVGIASDRDKDIFIGDLADDVTMRSTGHSWCLGDSNNGNCTGVVGCMMDVTMTKRCKSALITEEHLPAWLKIKERDEKLLKSEQIGKYQKQAIIRVLEETVYPTIKALESNAGSVEE